MKRGHDAGALLMRALRRDAVSAGCVATLDTLRSTPWASATFVGARHAWQVGGREPAVDRWLAALPDTDLVVPGHVLADLVVMRDGAMVTIEALTIEAA